MMAGMGRESGVRAIATNRKAFFSYEVIDRVEAGICLLGTEVKSIRDGGLAFRDAYVEYRDGELFLVGALIAPYRHGNLMNHPDDRPRKLLLHKREIHKLGGKTTERGLTLVPLKAYFKDGRIKLEIGLGRGKRAHDKREAIKRRDIERETRQAMRRQRD
jgi:SsrA-binding protein